MEEILNNWKKVNLTDHEAAKFLRGKDPDWTYEQVGNFTKHICNGKVEMVIKFSGKFLLDKTIWVNNDSNIKGKG